jgi:hypothetical protein
VASLISDPDAQANLESLAAGLPGGSSLDADEVERR